MFRSSFASVLALALAGLGAPARAQISLPPPADATEQALLPEVGALLGSGHADLAKLDALLARLPRPTPLRGMVQLARGVMLNQPDRVAEATMAAEEAARLLPEQPGPKLLLSAILTFAGEPRRAADLWLEASRLSPDMTREGDRYLVDALVGRLNDIGDRDRADLIRSRMAEIGFVASLAPDQSSAALAQVYRAVARQDLDTARTLLPNVANPQQMAQLWVDRRFAPLWPAIAQLGGPSLSQLHARYLTAVRGEWQRERDAETATNYARLLVAARDYRSVVSLFRPLIERDQADTDDPHIWFLVPVVARALAETGRPDEGRALLQKLDRRAVPSAAMRLNATGNLANLSHLTQRWEDAATQAGEWLSLAKRFGPEVNNSAILQVSALRACALAKTGRAAEAAPLVGELMLQQRAVPQPALTYRLCVGDVAGVRSLIVDRLSEEGTRGWALGLAQPAGPPGDLPEELAEHAVLEAARRDPAVRAAVAPVGRILPGPVAVGLPPGFDPDGADPARPPHPDSI